jgi:hypothetical protein
MNLVSFSLKTKGVSNFVRRLVTVFTRFSFSERKIRRSLLTATSTLQAYASAPTFFIPAVVLGRHPRLITEIAQQGVEIGVHGYVHNDYRTLNEQQQYTQTSRAIEIFNDARIEYAGFRNPYLGWTEESLEVFRQLGFRYESNEAVLHDVMELEKVSPIRQRGFRKSLELFQALPCTPYNLRPHLEGTLVRIPTSIPDDEITFDRLRITNPQEVGRLWSEIMERIYEREGIYTLNYHPERGLLCNQALQQLLEFASNQPLPIWITRLGEVANWWQERLAFRLSFSPRESGSWQVSATCTPRATLLGRYLEVVDQSAQSWFGAEYRVEAREFIVQASCLPCLALSPRTHATVEAFLHEQGYPVAINIDEELYDRYTCYLDLPAGLGQSREEQREQRNALLQKIEALETPLLRFACWPDGQRAALAISGDIDSVTIQDFFRRIIEVH